MKKIIFGIFAHPDDEAFGPAATLLHETKSGSELHLICLTSGESGMNPDGHADLGVVRVDEWRRAGELMGASEMHHLNYRDGELCNNDYHEIVHEVTEIIENTLSKQDNEYEIELMSMDFNGVTGHIDHIVVARVAAFIFHQQRDLGRPVTRLLQSCIPRSESPESNIDWLFMNAGYDENTCLKLAYPELHNEVLDIMHAHHSQRDDCETAIKNRGNQLTTNYFQVIE